MGTVGAGLLLKGANYLGGQALGYNGILGKTFWSEPGASSTTQSSSPENSAKAGLTSSLTPSGSTGGGGNKAGMGPMFGGGGGDGIPLSASFGGQNTPGYDSNGQRSWNAGLSKGWTPINMLQGGPDLTHLFNLNSLEK